jgi:hypothetical protein
MIPAEVKQFAEDPMASGVVWPSCEVVTEDRFVLWFGPSYYPGLAVVQRLRLHPDTVDESVASVRSLARARGVGRVIWQVGPSTTPSALGEALQQLGFTDGESLQLLVSSRAPEGAPDDIEVRRVETFEDFESFLRVQRSAFDDERALDDVRHAFEQETADENLVTYLAFVDGAPVSVGRATFSPAGVALNGGGTVPSARGRGAYRAVVAARWRDAVERGTPYLVTSARATSFPILQRMGFEKIGEVRQFVDEGF